MLDQRATVYLLSSGTAFHSVERLIPFRMSGDTCAGRAGMTDLSLRNQVLKGNRHHQTHLNWASWPIPH